ncbi:hypothetical protein OV450_2970 [Actinobacteria bacterium OV450]|nr:hypothetical protein OV450_2970 [Actinobacteria bacterium OV450]
MNDSPETPASADQRLAAQLLELVKHLEVVNTKNLRAVLRTLTADSRTKRFEAIGRVLQTLLGQLAATALVGGFIWLGYQMVQRGESGYAVLLAGMPASSIAAIFVLRQLPDFKAMAAFARQVNAMAANGTPAVPAQGGPPAGQATAPPGTPPAGGVTL